MRTCIRQYQAGRCEAGARRAHHGGKARGEAQAVSRCVPAAELVHEVRVLGFEHGYGADDAHIAASCRILQRLARQPSPEQVNREIAASLKRSLARAHEVRLETRKGLHAHQQSKQ